MYAYFLRYINWYLHEKQVSLLSGENIKYHPQ